MVGTGGITEDCYISDLIDDSWSFNCVMIKDRTKWFDDVMAANNDFALYEDLDLPLF